MVFTPFVVVDAFFVLLGLLILRRLFCSRRPASLPPGPMGLPLVGNVFDMPSEKEWLTFAQWGETWGQYEISYLCCRNPHETRR